jgi:hypothetical protein
VLSSSGEVARFVAAWRPRGVPSEAGAFARSVVGPLDVPSAVRARSLLWAASRLCAFALECGLAPEPDVVFSMPLTSWRTTSSGASAPTITTGSTA